MRGKSLSRSLIGCLCVFAAGMTVPSTGASPAPPGGTAVCERLVAQHLPPFSISRAVSNTSGSYSVPLPTGGTQVISGLPGFCDVTAEWRDPAGHVNTIIVWLPLSSWNGRFRGVGGGGFWCGPNYASPSSLVADLAGSVKAGFATASTDCGHSGSPADGSFARRPDGTLDRALVDDFASAGIHQMTVAGKAVTRAFYRAPAAKSYFFGCSTGGRQALMSAQRYPTDYDGIVAGAPAINWTRFVPALLWPQLVMNEAHDFLPLCKQQAFTDAVVKACDGLDGVTDGVIGDVDGCRWDPGTLVGQRTGCGTITATDAAVIAKIWQGPRSVRGQHLWYGLEPGASISGELLPGFGPTGLGWTSTENGVTTGRPFEIALSWYRDWLLGDQAWDWMTLGHEGFEQLFHRSVAEFSEQLATDDPDLSAFRRAGGKLVIWHGLADEEIFPQGTIEYYQRLTRATGGPHRTDKFARLFLAPGASHCAGGAGPAPADPFGAVVDWVEHGRDPKTLLATKTDPADGTVTLSRPLCRYPLVARYTGHGSTDDARNFRCATHYRDEKSNDHGTG